MGLFKSGAIYIIIIGVHFGSIGIGIIFGLNRIIVNF